MSKPGAAKLAAQDANRRAQTASLPFGEIRKKEGDLNVIARLVAVHTVHLNLSPNSKTPVLWPFRLFQCLAGHIV
jgi:hypothetical protein